MVPPPKTEWQERRALAQREANERAAAEGQALPFPNPWDRIDPTKIPREMAGTRMQASYAAFRELCPPRPRKRHQL
jgi:hypothetical protein